MTNAASLSCPYLLGLAFSMHSFQIMQDCSGHLYCRLAHGANYCIQFRSPFFCSVLMMSWKTPLLYQPLHFCLTLSKISPQTYHSSHSHTFFTKSFSLSLSVFPCFLSTLHFCTCLVSLPAFISPPPFLTLPARFHLSPDFRQI